jgi:3',5'-cyclic-nucleotide phosphodiesterase
LQSVITVCAEHELLDKNVLENHHVAEAFSIAQRDECAIFKQMQKDDYKKCRDMLISMVLATDMASHFADLGRLKSRMMEKFNPVNEDKQLCLNTLIHLADISNSTKTFEIYKEWVDSLFKEFF